MEMSGAVATGWAVGGEEASLTVRGHQKLGEHGPEWWPCDGEDM